MDETLTPVMCQEVHAQHKACGALALASPLDFEFLNAHL